MKKVLWFQLVFFVLLLGIWVHAQSASPSASPAAAVVSAPPSAPSGLAGWIQTQGGLVAAVGVIVTCLNILFSMLAQLFAKLSLAEPVWMQKVGSFLLKVVQWVGSNTPTPAAQVQAALDQQKGTPS